MTRMYLSTLFQRPPPSPPLPHSFYVLDLPCSGCLMFSLTQRDTRVPMSMPTSTAGPLPATTPCTHPNAAPCTRARVRCRTSICSVHIDPMLSTQPCCRPAMRGWASGPRKVACSGGGAPPQRKASPVHAGEPTACLAELPKYRRSACGWRARSPSHRWPCLAREWPRS